MKKIFAVFFIIIMIAVPLYAGDMSVLKVLRDANGLPVNGGLTNTGYVDAIKLSASAAQTYTVPTSANFLRFTGTANFYVKIGGTATVPTVTTATGAASILNPTLLSTGGSTSVSIISATDGAIITIESFK